MITSWVTLTDYTKVGTPKHDGQSQGATRPTFNVSDTVKKISVLRIVLHGINVKSLLFAGFDTNTSPLVQG